MLRIPLKKYSELVEQIGNGEPPSQLTSCHLDPTVWSHDVLIFEADFIILLLL